jgi:hypothetical protein
MILQQVIDVEVLFDQCQAARQGVSGLLGGESLKAAVPDTIVLAEITVNRLEAVVSLAGDNVWLLALGVSLPANDAFMSESRSHVVERGAPWDESVSEELMLGQHMSDLTVVGIEQLGEVTVGEQSALLVSLLAQTEGLAQQALGSGQAIDAQFNVLRGGEIKEYGDKIGIRDALVMAGRVIDADGHPECLSVCDVVLMAHVLEYNF